MGVVAAAVVVEVVEVVVVVLVVLLFLHQAFTLKHLIQSTNPTNQPSTTFEFLSQIDHVTVRDVDVVITGVEVVVVVVVVVVEVVVVVLVVVLLLHQAFTLKHILLSTNPTNQPSTTFEFLSQIDHVTVRDVDVLIVGVVVVVVVVVISEAVLAVLVVVLLGHQAFTLKHLLLSANPTDQPSIDVQVPKLDRPRGPLGTSA